MGKMELRRGNCIAKWKLAVKEQGKYVFMLHTELKPFITDNDFLRNSETSALACFREPVCSVMLFWPVDTSSSATTKGDTFEGGTETAFKCLLFLLSPSVLHVL